MIELILTLFLVNEKPELDVDALCRAYSRNEISREEAQARIDADSEESYEIQLEELCE